MKDKKITVAEAAEATGLTEVTIRRWIKAGKLPAYKLGKGYWIQMDDLQKAFCETADLLEDPDKIDIEAAKLEAIQTLITKLDPAIFSQEIQIALDTLTEFYGRE